jgi:hypothetical protein
MGDHRPEAKEERRPLWNISISEEKLPVSNISLLSAKKYL